MYFISNTVLSSLFNEGSSRTVIPKSSLVPSGLGIFKKASTSPMEGIYSGTNGFNFESKSIFYGLNLVIYSNRSFTSLLTCKFT